MKWFQLSNVEFAFTGNHLVIDRFSAPEEMCADLYSEDARKEIQMADWALVSQSHDQKAIAQDANLLMTTFWLMSDNTSPYIKFRFSPEDSEYAVMYDTLQPNRVNNPPFEEYTSKTLRCVYEACQELKTADGQLTSSRPHNAIYFLYIATHTVHWTCRFAFLMSALEAVFGNDHSRTKIKGQKGVTETIKTRVSHFVGDTVACSPELVGELYETRSRIVHGDIRANEDPAENLKTLKLMEDLVKQCFRKIVQNKVFRQFGDKLTRDTFLTSLD